MTLSDHHDWVSAAANKLVLGGSVLWQAMCAEWSKLCLAPETAKIITDAIKIKLPV